MKRQNITLYFFLVLGLVAIISIYIANQSLKETLGKVTDERIKLQAQSQAQSLLRQDQRLPPSIRKKKKFKETKGQQARPDQKESISQKIPDDNLYLEGEEIIDTLEGMETQESQETTIPQGDSEKQPSALEASEPKGVIIY